MNAPSSLPQQVLEEDIQIVRATLASITDDLTRFSPQAGQAVSEALEKLDEARAEFSRPVSID
jgi:hypothetical protein